MADWETVVEQRRIVSEGRRGVEFRMRGDDRTILQLFEGEAFEINLHVTNGVSVWSVIPKRTEEEEERLPQDGGVSSFSG